MSSYNGKAIENFITEEERDILLNFAKGAEQWDRTGDNFWDNRILSAQTIYQQHDKQVGKLMSDLRIRMAEQIKSSYDLDNVYPDITTLVRWFPGQEQHPHADDMSNIDGHDWFHHREFGSILYLNDDYSGGHTYYPQHEVDVSPKSKMLAIHPGDTNHMHGVTKVEGGIRYTIAAFWTTDKSFYDGWSV